MADQHILRLPLTGADDDSCVIVNVVSNGPLPLDVKLLASEGNYPFVGQSKLISEGIVCCYSLICIVNRMVQLSSVRSAN